MKKKLLFFIGLFLATLGAAKWAGIYWNTSDSFPPGIYQRIDGGPERDQLGLICLPRALGKTALDKAYVRPGTCPGGAQPLLKKIVGLPGDLVDITKEGVHVNGRRYPNSRRAPTDGAGTPMEGSLGSYRVPPDHLLLLSDYNRLSFDSRYFGTIPAGGYLGAAKPLITWD
ncbi:conjugative transfer signal peptidase TraF [Microbulbifer discodermiae]|uniref:conjugative transfer signal peptidase TraF n=1 Tax=Microbulbifer sp. 2201CG32-9 TaxID=3232309 RepID=UPI00345B5BE5